MAIFTNNLTSRLLLKSALECLDQPRARILEIGCGSGYISAELIASGKCDGKESYLSDVSTEAVEFAIKKLNNLVPPQNFRVGRCLDPWDEEKFDLIISDVAGISNSIAEISSWYQGVEFEAGEDGLTNTLEVVREAKKNLNSSGILIFPILSLTDRTKLRQELNIAFPKWHESKETKWPLPDDIAVRSELLQRLSSDGNISVEHKYGQLLASTSIAVCHL